MSLEAALAGLSLATAVSAVYGALREYQTRQREERIAGDLKEGIPPTISAASDPRELNEYLFRGAGPLSLREYATDAEARGVVEQAVTRIDDLMEGPIASPAREQGVRGRSAWEAFERGDAIGALARIRLETELTLRDLAAAYALRTEPTSPTRLIRQLEQVGALDPQSAADLLKAVRVANGALHGESFAEDEVRQAIEMATRGLEAIRRGSRSR
jgi:hypothetical protein